MGEIIFTNAFFITQKLGGAAGCRWSCLGCVGTGKGQLGVGEPVSVGGNSLLPQRQHLSQKQEIAYY